VGENGDFQLLNTILSQKRMQYGNDDLVINRKSHMNTIDLL